MKRGKRPGGMRVGLSNSSRIERLKGIIHYNMLMGWDAGS